jgi:hypothetical protein
VNTVIIQLGFEAEVVVTNTAKELFNFVFHIFDLIA